MLALLTRVGSKADLLWCFEPDYQFGLGIATNPLMAAPIDWGAREAELLSSLPRVSQGIESAPRGVPPSDATRMRLQTFKTHRFGPDKVRP